MVKKYQEESALANDSTISDLLSNQKVDKVLTGIYFEKEIADVLNKLSKQKGKGFKSEFVNAAIRKVLIEHNLI